MDDRIQGPRKSLNTFFSGRIKATTYAPMEPHRSRIRGKLVYKFIVGSDHSRLASVWPASCYNHETRTLF